MCEVLSWLSITSMIYCTTVQRLCSKSQCLTGHAYLSWMPSWPSNAHKLLQKPSLGWTIDLRCTQCALALVADQMNLRIRYAMQRADDLLTPAPQWTSTPAKYCILSPCDNIMMLNMLPIKLAYDCASIWALHTSALLGILQPSYLSDLLLQPWPLQWR